MRAFESNVKLKTSGDLVPVRGCDIAALYCGCRNKMLPTVAFTADVYSLTALGLEALSPDIDGQPRAARSQGPFPVLCTSLVSVLCVQISSHKDTNHSGLGSPPNSPILT